MKNPRLLFADMPLAIKEIRPTESYDLFPDNLCPIKGMHIEFENGRILSLQAGPGNYNQYIPDVFVRTPHPDYPDAFKVSYNLEYLKNIENWYNVATSVEIATWVGESDLQEMPENDTVLGGVTEEQLVYFVREVLQADLELGMCLAPAKILPEDWR